jgi:hypothetical protein
VTNGNEYQIQKQIQVYKEKEDEVLINRIRPNEKSLKMN